MSYIGNKTLQSNTVNGSIQSVFLLKKTESVAAALTLVAQYLKDEPESAALLRESAIRLIKDVHENMRTPDLSAKELDTHIGEVISLLHVLDRTRTLSNRNVQLLVDEIDNLQELIRHDYARTEEPDFSQYFLHEPAPHSNSEQKDTYEHYGHIETAGATHNVQHAYNKDRYAKGQSHGGAHVHTAQPVSAGATSSELQKDRRAIILGLLQKKDKITVKDVAGVVKDVSDKTLQRELLALVAQGVLKKEGERRWSTYSLAG